MRQLNYAIPTTGDRYFKESDRVNFEVTAPGNALMPQSMYFTFDLEVRTGVATYGPEPSGTRLNEAAKSHVDVKFDPYCGAHALFAQVDCMSDQGALEQLNYYPRLVANMVKNNAYNESLMNESDRAMALVVGEDNFSNRLLSALTPTDGVVQLALRPVCAFNATNAPVSFDKNGVLRVSVKLNTVQQALSGADNAPTVAYWISNFKLWYELVPDSYQGPVTFQRHQATSTTLNSSNVNISHLMPGLTNSMYASFIRTVDDASYTESCQKLAKLPNVTRVTFAFNDADNVRVSYPVENNEELMLLAQRAIGAGGVNSLRLSRQQQNPADSDAYGIGINFGQLVNTSKNKFDLNIVSDTTNGVDNQSNQYFGYLFFRGVAQLA